MANTDFFQDGSDDILFYNPTTGDFGFLDMYLGINFGWEYLGNSNGWSLEIGGNFGGAAFGTTDALFSSYDGFGGYTYGFVTIFEGAVTGWTQLGYVSSSWSVAGTASGSDFTGDGYDDILWQDSATGEVGYWDIFNGTIAEWVSLGTAGPGWTAFSGRAGGFDDDIFWYNENSGQLGVWNIENGVVQNWQNIGNDGNGWSLFGVGDLQGDQDIDAIFAFEDFSGYHLGYIDVDNGAARSWTYVGYSSYDWIMETTGDYDGDGDDDMLFQNNNTQQAGYWEMENGVAIDWVGVGYVDTGDWVVAG